VQSFEQPNQIERKMFVNHEQVVFALVEILDILQKDKALNYMPSCRSNRGSK
jgi:hypothetical protein